MNNSFLKVLRGGAGDSRKFISAYVTDSRLMGVLIVYLHFDSGEHFFFYIDTGESGIEWVKIFSDDSAPEIFNTEKEMLSGLAANKIDINLSEAESILQQYADLTLRKGYKLPGKVNLYEFLLEKKHKLKEPAKQLILSKICAPLKSNEHVINYFLMRFFERDFETLPMFVSGKLEDFSMEDMPDEPETLLMNSISEKDGVYHCESILQTSFPKPQGTYRLVFSEIFMQQKHIVSFKVKNKLQISQAEVGMKMNRPEYITVYDIRTDIDSIKNEVKDSFPGALVDVHEFGTLHFAFNDDNDHVNSKVFRLDNDVSALIYITEYGQLILVSYDKFIMPLFERVFEEKNPFKNYLRINIRYEFRESVFHDFFDSDFLSFNDFAEFLSD